MITIKEAEQRIGDSVRYEREWCDPEIGVITSVSSRTVFVRYDRQHPTAPGQGTNPADLTFVNRGS